MVPGLNVLPVGAATDHVTALLKLPVPVTAAVNCTCVPMVAMFGVTVMAVMAPALKAAVAVVSALIVKVQTSALEVGVQPLHPVKTLPPAEEGAVSVTVLPAL
jgi:hypothetical protein